MRLSRCNRMECLINGWSGECRGLIDQDPKTCRFYKDSRDLPKWEVAKYEAGVMDRFIPKGTILHGLTAAEVGNRAGERRKDFDTLRHKQTN